MATRTEEEEEGCLVVDSRFLRLWMTSVLLNLSMTARVLNHSVKVMGKGVDDGHAGEVIIEVVQGEGIRSEGLDDPDLLINPVDNTIQGFRGVLPDGEEVLVGLERMSFTFMDWRTMPLNDPTLLCLFHMGFFDWDGEDNYLHQTTQAMRHSTLLVGQIFERLLKTQEQVFFLSALVDSRLTRKL